MNKLHRFSGELSRITLPTSLPYPHNYHPHPIAKQAAEELQTYLTHTTDFLHDFGLLPGQSGVGKMFGVLVVLDTVGELGYLTAFSGKLDNSYHQQHFVPPVYDSFDPKGPYKQLERQIEQLSDQLEACRKAPEYLEAKSVYTALKNKYEPQYQTEVQKIKERRLNRKKTGTINNQQNINEEFYLKEYATYIEQQTANSRKTTELWEQKITQLERLRGEISAKAQNALFASYAFYNQGKEVKTLIDLFDHQHQSIPAGAGECCAPKLFQYAHIHGLHPIAMAEFWWGAPLSSTVRIHQNYYPACTGKCKPILAHMLQGLPVASNPLVAFQKVVDTVEILFEDDYLLAVNKPHDVLSVTGKEITENTIETWAKKRYPNATGPLLVHRLDMATSGVLLIAKSKAVHKALQGQFIKKTVQKRYLAVLSKKIEENSGQINLPLRVDLDDRPKQLVCPEHGKHALTRWEKISETANTTRVYFYPVTGRTHQLRVHAAHQLGLGAPIVGDDLYGIRDQRLHLHAERLTLIHPVEKHTFIIEAKAPF